MTSQSLNSIGVDKLRGVGPQLAAKLHKLGLFTLQDLLFHLPLRYIDRTKITAIGGVHPLTEVVIEGEVRGSDVVFGRRRSLVCRVQDHSGLMTLRFFTLIRPSSRVCNRAPKCAALAKCAAASPDWRCITRNISY